MWHVTFDSFIFSGSGCPGYGLTLRLLRLHWTSRRTLAQARTCKKTGCVE